MSEKEKKRDRGVIASVPSRRYQPFISSRGNKFRYFTASRLRQAALQRELAAIPAI